VAGSGVVDDRRSHQPDRSGAGDQHVFPEDREQERRVDGVPEGIEDRRDVPVDPGVVVPDVRHRQGDVVCERARPVDTDTFGVRAQVASTRHAVPASAAHHVALTADEVARSEVAHIRADLGDLSDELVPDHEWNRDGPLGPVVPLLDVEVGPADARPVDPDEHVVDADLGLRHVGHHETGSAIPLHESSHPAPDPIVDP
jgi:hypothetical protein